jgi:hypothetical protein
MKKTITFTLILIFLIFTFFQLSLAQKGDQLTRFAFGLNGGFFLSFGDWQTHRFALDVNQFRGDIVIGPALEINYKDIAVGGFFNYTNLNVKDWEDFALSEGDVVDASAHIEEYGLIIKYYFITRKPDYLNFQFGISYFSIKGQESYSGYSYDYDFLNSGLGFYFGSGYDYFLSDRFALSLNGRFIFFKSGVTYPEKGEFDITGIPLTLGFRVFL